ncbi:hypothetical protein VT06_04680 [Arsukibacterium sp. MJ3]|uniref:DUF3081 family protein n=1 Tax=Arsukibacterium sp. MJ3 TaxID=1632859 RepID=UPI000627052A|nr:DUF3081 family protein [Arsukibacterium sp. MJ3]KKO49890.1 hypothetical protein VT06_04680 [Arsukibacterium sp. MJ3]
MQNELDGKLLLNVYSKVEKNGQSVTTNNGAGFTLDGLTVSQGFDGYEVYYASSKVQLTLGFHHKWHSDAQNEKDMDAFIELIKHINNNY